MHSARTSGTHATSHIGNLDPACGMGHLHIYHSATERGLGPRRRLCRDGEAFSAAGARTANRFGKVHRCAGGIRKDAFSGHDLDTSMPARGSMAYSSFIRRFVEQKSPRPDGEDCTFGK